MEPQLKEKWLKFLLKNSSYIQKPLTIRVNQSSDSRIAKLALKRNLHILITAPLSEKFFNPLGQYLG